MQVELVLGKNDLGKKIELSKSNASQELYRPASWTSERVYQLIYKLLLIYNELSNMSIGKTNFFLKKGDFCIFFVFFCIFFLSFCMILHKGEKSVLTVSAGGDKYAYDLKKDTVITVDGDIGKTIIVIKNGEAFITDSPCPNKTCVHSGKIKRPGECLCCAPNKVFACVEGQQDENEKPDAVSY